MAMVDRLTTIVHDHEPSAMSDGGSESSRGPQSREELRGGVALAGEARRRFQDLAVGIRRALRVACLLQRDAEIETRLHERRRGGQRALEPHDRLARPA